MAHGSGGHEYRGRSSGFYKDIDDIQQTFGKFLALLPEKDDLAVGNGDDPRVVEELEKLHCRHYTFGFGEGCDYCPANLRQ